MPGARAGPGAWARHNSPRTNTAPVGASASRTTPTSPMSSRPPEREAGRFACPAFTTASVAMAASAAPTPTATHAETAKSSPAGSNSSSAPAAKATAPHAANTPTPGANASAANRPAASAISAMPAQLSGRAWSPNRASTRLSAPSVPGITSPGLAISMMIPRTPTDSRMTMRFGSMRTFRIDRHVESSTYSTRAPAVSSTSPFGSVRVPSMRSSRVARSGATTSTTFLRAASRAVRFAPSRTASSAQSPSRPCSSASARRYAAASLMALRRASSGSSPPCTEIGVDEPRLVCGAIAATSAAIMRNTPADAARAPSGAT